MMRVILGAGVVMLGFALALPEAQAKRLGGGSSVGVQRSVAGSSRPAAAPTQSQPAQAGAPAASSAAPAAAPAGGSRWLPLLGGLALGGVLGSLLGGAGGMVALFVVLALVAGVGLLLVSRSRASARPAPMQYAGATAGASYGSGPLGAETMVPPFPEKVAAEEASRAAQPQRVPADFDAQGFLRAAKMNFIKLQVANDKGKLDEISAVTTAEMFDLLKRSIEERSGAAQHTDVVSLNADLLEVTTEDGRYCASVRFSGMVWEVAGSMPVGFEEVWHLVKPVDGSSGWLLAGIQQTH